MLKFLYKLNFFVLFISAFLSAQTGSTIFLVVANLAVNNVIPAMVVALLTVQVVSKIGFSLILKY